MRKPLLLACVVLLGACDDPTTPPRPLPEPQFVIGRYTYYPDRTSRDLYLVGADGDWALNLTKTPDVDERAPAWSRDGKRIAYIRWNPYSMPFTDELWVMNADGSGAVPLARHEEASRAYDPTWSPTGRQIAYVVNDELVLINADGSGAKPIVKGMMAVGSPTWSPDGTRLAFEGFDGEGWNIYTVRVDGTGLVQITPSSSYNGHPAWSPDGSRIAFNRAGKGSGSWTLWTMRPDGSEAVQMVEAEDRSVAYPSWSPDGRWLAYVLRRWQSAEGFIIPADGARGERRSIGRLEERLAWHP